MGKEIVCNYTARLLPELWKDFMFHVCEEPPMMSRGSYKQQLPIDVHGKGPAEWATDEEDKIWPLEAREDCSNMGLSQ